jgi:hypothetical protein
MGEGPGRQAKAQPDEPRFASDELVVTMGSGELWICRARRKA